MKLEPMPAFSLKNHVPAFDKMIAKTQYKRKTTNTIKSPKDNCFVVGQTC